MKLAFTTLACPQWDLETIIARAVEYGYDGVDFRCYRGKLTLWEMPEFSTNLERTAGKLKEAKLEVPCLDCSADLAGNPDWAVKEIQFFLPICRGLGARMLRVFGGAVKGKTAAESIDTAAETLRRVIPVARDQGVQIVVETHDYWIDTEPLRQLMKRVNSPQVGVLWDVHHPFRVQGEPPTTTWQRIGKWVRYTHFKDSAEKPGAPEGFEYCLAGQGTVPIREIVDCLRQGGYDGYLALEWEKMWVPDLAEPEVALPAYAGFMKGLLGPTPKKR